MIMRLSKGGLIASVVYTIHFFIFFGWASFSDVKASAMWTAIAEFPAALVLSTMVALFGLRDFPYAVDSWLNSNVAYYLESLTICYFVGWAASARTLKSDMRSRSEGKADL